MEFGIGEVNLDGRRMFTGTVCDITEQKRFEVALRDSEERMLLVTNAVPALIAYINTDHHYRFANNYYEDLHGIKVEDIVGKHTRDILERSFTRKPSPIGRQPSLEKTSPSKTRCRTRMESPVASRPRTYPV